MVGSPNYVFMTYDADQSSFTAPVAVPPGSAQIEDVFESFATLRGEPYDEGAARAAPSAQITARSRRRPGRRRSDAGRDPSRRVSR
jgi:hypothetical protein